MDKMATEKKEFRCHFEGCSRLFKRRDRLEVHLRTHTGERPFVCHYPGCASSYARSQHLSRHIEVVHSIENKLLSKIECPQCGAMLANKACLKRHSKRFHTIPEGGKYSCPEEGCSEVFRKKQQLVVHREKDHACNLSAAPSLFKCPHEGCHKSFIFPTRLKRHMKIHRGYPCTFENCGEMFETWTQLRRHKATFHAPKYICHTCKSEFTSKTNLVQHLKIHLYQPQTFTCPRDGCERIFNYKKNLRQHIRAYHEGEVVFVRKKKPPSEQAKRRRSHWMSKKRNAAARLCGITGSIESFSDCTVSEQMLQISLDRPTSTESTPVSNTVNAESLTASSTTEVLPVSTTTSIQDSQSASCRSTSIVESQNVIVLSTNANLSVSNDIIGKELLLSPVTSYSIDFKDSECNSSAHDAESILALDTNSEESISLPIKDTNSLPVSNQDFRELVSAANTSSDTEELISTSSKHIDTSRSTEESLLISSKNAFINVEELSKTSIINTEKSTISNTDTDTNSQPISTMLNQSLPPFEEDKELTPIAVEVTDNASFSDVNSSHETKCESSDPQTREILLESSKCYTGEAVIEVLSRYNI